MQTSSLPQPRQQPADPEPFTLNRETGAKGEVSKNQGTGYGVRGKGAVVVVLRRRCFFSELRVITLKTKKYSTLKTTTTTDYLHQSLKPQQAEATVDPQRPRSIFFSDTHLYTAHTCEKAAPHRWRSGKNGTYLKGKAAGWRERQKPDELAGEARKTSESAYTWCLHLPSPRKRQSPNPLRIRAFIWLRRLGSNQGPSG